MKNSINYTASFFKTIGLISLLLAIIISGVVLGHAFFPGVKQDINYWFGFMGAFWIAAVIGNSVYEVVIKILSPFFPCKHGVLGGKTKEKCSQCAEELHLYKV